MDEPADFIRDTWLHLLLARCVAIVADLKVADVVAERPRTAAAIAEIVKADPDALHRMLRMLASHGVFAEDEAGAFHLTARAEVLRTGTPGSLRERWSLAWQDLIWDAYRALPDAVRGAGNAFELAHGLPFFDYLAEHPEAGRAFDRAMARVSGPEDEAIAAAFPFGHFARVVDIGAGRGGLLQAILSRHPRVTAVLFDRPDVIGGDDNLLVTARDRCEAVGGDFFDAVPAGGDLYVLKRIIHDWDDAAAAVILGKVRRAMASDGRLLLLEAVIEPGNAPDPTKDLDVNIMALTRGRERSEAEFARLLARCGFRLDRVSATTPPAAVRLIEASPAAVGTG